MILEIENNVLLKAKLEDGEAEAVIPDGVKKIGSGAFFICYELTSVTIPDTVTEIGYAAFSGCRGLTALRIPGSVADIEERAFESCAKLVTNLSIKQWENKYGLKKLDYALHYMRSYQSGDPFFDDVKPENDKYIKAQREKLIRKIAVKDAAVVSYLTREDWLSADDIDYLLDRLSENVEITAMLLDYKHRHFTDEYLEQRETDKFQKEVGIKERTLAEWKKIYQLGEDKESGGYILKKYNGTDTEIMIPDHIAGKPVTRIGKRCFSPCSTTSCEVSLVRRNIRSVYIPDTVICIEECAFHECQSLAEITIPNSVVTIEDLAFDHCRSLTEVTLPESLNTISKGSFSCCESLEHIQIPKKVTHIGEHAFNSCGKLTEINIPDNVEEIGSAAFSGCSALKEINFPDTVKKIGHSAFSSCSALKKVTLPKGLKTISPYLFSICSALAEVEIPESVTLIQCYAFYGCSLDEITLPKRITSIESFTFGHCKSLERVILSDELTKIENSAFSMCTALHEITIPASVSYIDHAAFYKTNDLIITAPRGSYAIEYARESGIKFKELPV